MSDRNPAPPDSKFQLSKVGFPIRKSAGQRPFAPHRSLSQRTTSFIASYRQGIHQMPLGRLIALISNAHLMVSFHRTLRCVGPRPSAGRHCSIERPEVIEINLGPDCGRNPKPPRSTKNHCWRHASLAGDTSFWLIPPAYPSSRCQQPQCQHSGKAETFAFFHGTMVEPDGIEPTTSCLQSTRSPS
jgi:hypothetical protein